MSKKILIHSLIFSPDGVSTAYLYNDIALKFQENGYEVVVLTTTPHYNIVKSQLAAQPLKWKILGICKESNFHGIRVLHVPQKKFKCTFLRILGFTYWHVVSFFICLFQKDIDVILSPSPPLTIGVINLWLAKIKGCKTIYNVQEIYPDIFTWEVSRLPDALSIVREKTGQKFIIIIDEWDVLIRDAATNGKVQEAYINFLRGMFKGTEPTKYIQLAYLTGILPVKKEKTQSALNNFDEFTMMSASNLAPYIGFTEDEVEKLSKEYHQDFDKVKRWYDGYLLKDYQVYNPRAVVGVMLKGEFKSYWSETASYEAVTPLINMNYDGLKNAIIEILSGASIKVNTTAFKNDTVNIQSKDDVLTYLIHLGYLGYDQNRRTAFVPNEEIRQELTNAVKSRKWNEMITFQQESERLLEATLDMDEEAVAEGIEKIHVSNIQYNNENSLSSVLAIAYLSSMEYYFKPVRELPTGRGFADFVFIPKPEYISDYPALIVELKWNKNAETALQQIKKRKYPEAIQQYTGDILLVGINYDKKTKKHQCLMESYEKQER